MLNNPVEFPLKNFCRIRRVEPDVVGGATPDGFLKENAGLFNVIVMSCPAHIHALVELVNSRGSPLRVAQRHALIAMPYGSQSHLTEQIQVVVAHISEGVNERAQVQTLRDHHFQAGLELAPDQLRRRGAPREINVAERVRTDLVPHLARADQLYEIRRIPVGVFLAVGTGIVAVPVTFPTEVSGGAGAFRGGQGPKVRVRIAPEKDARPSPK